MKNKKLIKLGTSLALVAAIGVGATLAYLSEQSNDLTNHFTVGEGYVPEEPDGLAVWIDETDYTNPEERTREGNTYNNIMAGYSYTKDPILTVNGGSIESYAFIKVTGADALAAKGVTFDFSSDWELIAKDTGATLDGVYQWIKTTSTDPEEKGILNPQAKDENNEYKDASTTPLFTKVTISPSFVSEDEGVKVSLDDLELLGCAVQAVTYDENGNRTVIADPANPFAQTE